MDRERGRGFFVICGEEDFMKKIVQALSLNAGSACGSDLEMEVAPTRSEWA